MAAAGWGGDLNREEAATSRFPSRNPVFGLASAPPYTPPMTRSKIDAPLELMTGVGVG